MIMYGMSDEFPDADIFIIHTGPTIDGLDRLPDNSTFDDITFGNVIFIKGFWMTYYYIYNMKRYRLEELKVLYSLMDGDTLTNVRDKARLYFDCIKLLGEI